MDTASRLKIGFAGSLIGLLCLVGCTVEPAELVLLNGKLTTLDPDHPGASALAASGGRILAVGSDEEVRAYVGDGTRTIDLEGALAVPGFIEGHGHFTGIGRSLMNIDLTGARSWDEVVATIGEVATRTPRGDWILGWGWHQEKWDEPPSPSVEGYPTHDALSRVTLNNPVLLKHAAGSHAGLANQSALKRASIYKETEDPPGGKILRHPDGRPTGVLREAAYALALAAYDRRMARRSPERIAEDARKEIELANRECLARGITSFQDAGSSFETVDRLKAMAENGELGVRLWVMLREDNDALEQQIDRYRMEGVGDDRLTVRAIKRSIDGALGSHGAWLLEPYSDLTDSHGHNTDPIAQMRRTAEIAMEHDFQLCVHAIGDRANRETLDLYKRAFAKNPDRRDVRWRIEHAQHLHPDDIPRFAELGVVASMQGVHCTSDGPWVPVRLGDERSANGAYVWRKLLESGAVVINGTDAPIEDVDPIANFFSTVTRQTGDGTAFYPDQKMTREEALRSYTLDAAFAAFEEQDKGSLTPGKLADVTVLSRDILTVPDDQILSTEVLYTIVGGRVLYERPAAGTETR